MADKGHANDICRDGFAITPHDSNDEAEPIVGLYVGVTGDIVAVTQKGTQLTFKNAQQGSVIPWMFTRVNSTGTTATDLVGGTL